VLFAPGHSDLMSVIRVEPTQRDLITNLLITAFFYVNYFLLIPRLYFPKKYFLFFAIASLYFLLIAVIPAALIPHRQYGIDREMHAPGPPGNSKPGGHSVEMPPSNESKSKLPPPEPDGNTPFEIVHRFILFIAILFFSLVLSINNRWKQAEKEKINAELSYLKAQINPHFLFNTLNSIYSLAIEKSDRTATAVVKLSDMMRYVLTESGEAFTALEKEITYISNFIELQRIRFGDSIRLNYSVEGNVKGKAIAPLLLISFIENAFKHGVNAAEDSCINITIEVSERNLAMQVGNNIVAVRQNNVEEANGLGLQNTKNRLQLLYPGKHSLEIKQTRLTYTVSLSIELI